MTQVPFQYSEILPPPAMRGFVKCVWHLRGPAMAGALPEPVLPDGCVEIVLNCGDPFRRFHDTGVDIQPPRLVAGQLTRAVSIAPTGEVDLWGIRFQSWGAAGFLGISGAELRDRMIPLDVIGDLDRLLARVVDETSDAARQRQLFGGLGEWLARARRPDPKLPGLAMLAASGGVSSVKGLAAAAGVSMRRVQSLFAEQVGLSPKSLMRIARFQRAIALARESPTISLARVAMDSGYFDHAHLVRDAREIVGVAPSALVPEMGALTMVFIAPED